MMVRGVRVLDEIAAQRLEGSRRSGESQYRPAHSILITVLVTGIQSTRVCAAGGLFSAQVLGLAGFL